MRAVAYLSIPLLLIAVAAPAAVVLPLGAASQVLVPAAGSAAGANGTFFRSDITIINFTSHDQFVKLQWLPQAGSGGSTIVSPIEIPALSGIRSADFVHDYFNTTGLGSIIITGVAAGGTFDATSALYVASRIWTPQPGTAGTTSQSFPAVPLGSINTPSAVLFSLGAATNLGNFRVNVGIVNIDENNAQTFSVQIPGSGSAPQVVTLPPLSMQQVTLGSGIGNLTEVTITNTTPSATKSNLWTAYGSTVDNVTGDAWSELAIVGTSP